MSRKVVKQLLSLRAWKCGTLWESAVKLWFSDDIVIKLATDLTMWYIWVLTYLSHYELRTFCHSLRLINYKKRYLLKSIIKSETRCYFPVKRGNGIKKTVDLKDKMQWPPFRHISSFSKPDYVANKCFKNCNLSECCLHSFKHFKHITELTQRHAICLGISI